MKLHRQRGFTIVELLIVIVVIAILAAITIVTYNGIQDRANRLVLQNDLANAAKQLKLAKAETDGDYPNTLPSSVKVPSGDVLQLASVSDPTSSFCINGYGKNNLIMSYHSGGGIKAYPCNGALIGSPVGGSVPGVQSNANLVADFSEWDLSGGVSYDNSSGELKLSSSGGAAISPLVRVDGAAYCRFRVEAYATQPSPMATPQTQVYAGSRYFGADGTTQVFNSADWKANGNAQNFDMNTWFNYNWNTPCGPNVKYIRFVLHSSPSNRTSDNRYRSPQITIP